MIGFFSDSHGDLDAFDAAYELLKRKGARRFLFAGGRYGDLDEWIARRRARARGDASYSDNDFLSDVGQWLMQSDQPPASARLGAPGGGAGSGDEGAADPTNLLELFRRTPERESLQYRDPAISRKEVDMIDGVLCTLVYDKNDLGRDDLVNARIFFHGKEPDPKLVQIGPRIFLTPGRLTGAAEQTCALVGVKEHLLLFTAFTLEGRALLEEQRLLRGGPKKLSVR